MVCVRRDDPLARILPAVVESGHSRFPVIDEDRDDVVGILLAKDLLRSAGSGAATRFDIREFMRPAVFVPESKRLNVLLKEFRRNRNHMAIVVDEYGGVAGLVTIEDVIEQIVGEIDDEFDVEDDQNIRATASGSSVRGATRIGEFNEYFGSAFADDEFDTIAGLVMQQFGRLPRRGEVVRDRRLRVPGAAHRPAAHRAAARRAARAAPAAREQCPAGGGAPWPSWPLALLRGAPRRWPSRPSAVAAGIAAPRCCCGCGPGPRRARAARLGLGFGVGTFAAGTWWLYISIHGFGGAPLSLAVAADPGPGRDHGELLRAARLAGRAGAPAGRRGAGAWGCRRCGCWWNGCAAGFFRASRGSRWATRRPTRGCAGLRAGARRVRLSALLLLQAGALRVLARPQAARAVRALALFAGPWVGGRAWAHAWTHPDGAPVPVASSQGAIPQDLKWQIANRGRPSSCIARSTTRRWARA